MVYLTVLTASMIVVVLGVSALLAVRLQQQVAQTANRAVSARVHARSAIELALTRLHDDPDWRHTYEHATWNSAGTLGETTLHFKLEDTADTNLADNPDNRAWLYGRARIGQVQRLARVMLQPTVQLTESNRLANPDMEAGTRQWAADPPGQVRYTEQRAESGAGSLYLDRRTQPYVGIHQTITDQLERDTSYYAEAWLRLPDENEDGDQTFTLVLYTRDDSGTERHNTVGSVTVHGPWQRISGTITPTWSGNLAEAQWRIVTESNSGPFYLDSAMLIRESDRHGMTPVAGTWSQVVQ